MRAAGALAKASRSLCNPLQAGWGLVGWGAPGVSMGSVGGTRRLPLPIWRQQDNKGSVAVGVHPFLEKFTGRLGFMGCSCFDSAVDRKSLERRWLSTTLWDLLQAGAWPPREAPPRRPTGSGGTSQHAELASPGAARGCWALSDLVFSRPRGLAARAADTACAWEQPRLHVRFWGIRG